MHDVTVIAQFMERENTTLNILKKYNISSC